MLLWVTYINPTSPLLWGEKSSTLTIWIPWIFCRSLMLFKDFPCDKAFHHNTNQFFYQYFKLGPPPSPIFLSTVFTLKQNRMNLNCFSRVYAVMDIDVHLLLFQTWWCHRQRQSGKQIHYCCKSGMLKSIKHWFCINLYSISLFGEILTISKFQGKCKIVSDFQGRRSETRPDRIRKMFHPEVEEAFPLYTTMKKIRAMDPCPRK